MNNIIPTTLLCKLPVKIADEEECLQWLLERCKALPDTRVTVSDAFALVDEKNLVLSSVKPMELGDLNAASDLVKEYLAKWWGSRSVILQCRTTTKSGRFTTSRVHIGPKGITVSFKSAKYPSHRGIR